MCRLAPDPGVQRWRHRLNRLQNLLFGGCNLDRDVRSLVSGAGFDLQTLDQYYVLGVPRFAGFLTRGSAA